MGGQFGLLAQNTSRTIHRAYVKRRRDPVLRRRNQLRTGFPIHEYEIAMGLVDLRQRRQQAAQINFRAADSAGNQVQRIDADSQRARTRFVHRVLAF